MLLVTPQAEHARIAPSNAAARNRLPPPAMPRRSRFNCPLVRIILPRRVP
jgi:hypothetical protein